MSGLTSNPCQLLQAHLDVARGRDLTKRRQSLPHSVGEVAVTPLRRQPAAVCANTVAFFNTTFLLLFVVRNLPHVRLLAEPVEHPGKSDRRRHDDQQRVQNRRQLRPHKPPRFHDHELVRQVQRIREHADERQRRQPVARPIRLSTRGSVSRRRPGLFSLHRAIHENEETRSPTAGASTSRRDREEACPSAWREESLKSLMPTTMAAAPSQRLRHHFGSLTRPNAASTAIAPSAQVNQCEAAASGTGTPVPVVTQIA